MIGNSETAAYALRMYRERDYSEVLSGDGSTRMVYLIDGIVYKVEGLTGTNETEFDFMNTMRDELPAGYYFPNVSLFDIDGESVIAMDYISGQPVSECYCTQDEECDDDCMPRDCVATMEDLMLDSGGYNVIVTDKGYCIIDAA